MNNLDWLLNNVARRKLLGAILLLAFSQTTAQGLNDNEDIY